MVVVVIRAVLFEVYIRAPDIENSNMDQRIRDGDHGLRPAVDLRRL